jgi:hypothetical protein
MNPITEYREAQARLRAIARNKGKTNATVFAQVRWNHYAKKAIDTLVTEYGDQGHHIVGLLVEESKLADRDWQHRPELKARMLKLRRELRELDASL